jgi:hypothetical protein
MSSAGSRLHVVVADAVAQRRVHKPGCAGMQVYINYVIDLCTGWIHVPDGFLTVHRCLLLGLLQGMC